MRTCIRSLGLTLVLLLLAGCATLQSLVGPPPTPTPALPDLPAPMPEDPYGLDFPPMPVWDFYREWLENPAAAHYKYRGRTVTLAYARGMVPHPSDGMFFAALQAPKGLDTRGIRHGIERGTMNGSSHDPIEAGWGPWLESYHRPTSGRDFQLRCDRAQNLSGIIHSFFLLEMGPNDVADHVGPFFHESPNPVSEAAPLWDEFRPLVKAPPMLRLQAEKWNDLVYVVHGRVLGHVVGQSPYGGYNYSQGDYVSIDGERLTRDYLYIEMDHCVFELMDISASELDAWFDADRERLTNPDGAAYRPIIREDHVVPVARPLTWEIERRIQEHAHPRTMTSIVGRVGDRYVLQNGMARFQLLPIADFTEPRSSAPPLPVITDSGNVRITSPGFVGPYPLSLDTLRRNWIYAKEGPCKHLGQDWPQCIPVAKEAWLSDPENRRKWIANGGD